jgi:hypothetical protein
MIPKVKYGIEQCEQKGFTFTNIKVESVSYSTLDKTAKKVDCLFSDLIAIHLGEGVFGVFYKDVKTKQPYQSLAILNF